MMLPKRFRDSLLFWLAEYLAAVVGLMWLNVLDIATMSAWFGIVMGAVFVSLCWRFCIAARK